MINFELKELDKVMLFGGNPKYTAHWFALTDGIYWLNFGQTNIYEYSDDFLKDCDSKTKFVDYYIVRILEDFTELFLDIGESIPTELYKWIETPEKLSNFSMKIEQWYQKHEDKDDNDEFFDKKYNMESWIHHRTLYASHLQNAPAISFFRVDNDLHVIWQTDNTTDNGLAVWTAKNGSVTMDYTEFIKQIEDFGNKFFAAMDIQLQKAIDKDWGENVEIDKPRLLTEQQERKDEFEQKLNLLKLSTSTTDWSEIETLITKLDK